MENTSNQSSWNGLFYVNGKNQKPAHVPEDQLFKRFKEHEDFRAFDKIFKQLYTRLFQSSFKLVDSHETAEEIVDDVFISLWQNRKKIFIQSSFKAYLSIAVRNRSLDYLRNHKRSKSCSLENAVHVPCGQATPLDVIGYHELKRRIEKAIDKLPKQCKIIFLLSKDHSLKYKEIAERLNISIKTVETQISRARKHLRVAVNNS